MRPTRFCIVRHGETDWNTQKRIQGQLDTPLNPTGRWQAAAAGRRLATQRVDRIYSSDLQRTLETAAIIAGGSGLRVQAHAGLRERHFGCLQGLTPDEMASHVPEAHARYRRRDPDHAFGDGESLAAFAARVVATLETLAIAHPGENLPLVSHGGVLDVIYRRATGRDLSQPRDFPIPNAALNWVEAASGRWRVVDWGRQEHLAGSLEEAVQ